MPVVGQRRPTALGVHIFAGGFTCGVKQAGFRVLAHLEDTEYGVASARANWPDLDVRVGEASWRPGDFAGRVDFLYSNPPCAIFSTAGTNKGESWRDDPRLGCWRRSMTVLEAIRPRVFALESVCRAYTAGRPVVDDMTRRALSMGYSVVHLQVDASKIGVCQRRRRFFLVFHEPGLAPDFTAGRRDGPTVSAALSGVGDPGRYTDLPRLAEFIARTPPGGKLRDSFDTLSTSQERNRAGEMKGRPGFLYARLPSDGHMGAFVGDVFIHPTEDRFLGVNEMRALCGYPADFKLVGSGQGNQLSRAVLPPVGRWIAGVVRAALVGTPAHESSQRVTSVDLRDDPPRTTDLTAEYSAVDVGAGQAAEEEEVHVEAARVVHAAEITTEAAANAAVRRQKTSKDRLPAHVDPDRRFDKTALTKNNTGRFVHRDYAAHYFRWGFAGRFTIMLEGRGSVLDVGCGTDQPLMEILSKNKAWVPGSYLGVDYNKQPRKPMTRSWAKFLWEFDFTSRHAELGQFDLVVSFEVLEHMRREDGLRFIGGLAACLAPSGRLLLSTPVFNGRAAAHHLHEWTAAELRTALEAAGLRVEARYGTFASYPDVKKACSPAELVLLDELRRFYSDEVMACFLAPKYPDASRNNVWVLRRVPGPPPPRTVVLRNPAARTE